MNIFLIDISVQHGIYLFVILPLKDCNIQRKFPGLDLSPKLVHCNLLCVEEQSPCKDADSPAATVGKLCAVCAPTHGAGAEHVRAGEPGDARVGLGSSTNLASWTVSLLRATTL